MLESGADDVDLSVVEAVNVRLRRGRIVIPDVVVVPDDSQSVFDSSDVALVAEVVSPGNAATDRVLKMQLHALAEIKWYLLVQGEPLQLWLLRIEGGHYVEHATAREGEAINLVEPFPVQIDVSRLVRRPPKS